MPLNVSSLKLKRQIIILIFFAMAIFSGTYEIGQTALSIHPQVWVTTGLERIQQNQDVGLESDIKLFAARGEYESFQIGVKAPQGGLTNVNVSVTDLSGTNNGVISKSNFTLYRQHYIAVNNSSPQEEGSPNPPLGTGLYPDALIPFVHPETKLELKGSEYDAVPFKLDAGKNQPIWVDVFIPRNAQPGEYNGTYTVSSDQGKFTGDIFLKVWNFQLPLKPSLKSSFLVWEERSKNKSAFVELLKHKIMPATDINPSIQRELIDSWGLNSLKLPFFSGADFHNGKMEAAPSVDEIKKQKAKNQPDLFQYVYSVDEIDRWPQLQEPLKLWSQNIKKAGVKHMAVMTPVSGLYENDFFDGQPAVDIWVVLPKMYEAAQSRVSEAMKNGCEVWFYTAFAEDAHSPKWLIDFAPINFRIPHGFINQSLGLSGLFYWRVDLWKGNPWKEEQTVFEDKRYYPGEGILVYPGQELGIEGIVPSIRLKWIRDGVEDYEYIQTLKNLGREDIALSISRSIAYDWKNWTKEPQKLEEARQKLALEIEKAS